jgi:class 3 adenylate cyclase
VWCPNCTNNVPEGSKFCGKCGTALPGTCPSCGRSVPPENSYCAECGSAIVVGNVVTAASKSHRTTLTMPRGSSAERRQLTIMFCDMVGSSALSTRLDPEDQGDVIAAFHTCCATEIQSLGGMVAQYLGDGVLAYFGYPTAHENDAERAILSGLAILKAIVASKPAGVLLQARIAIGSGVVVVGDLVRQSVTQENAAIVETTNLVARLQALAEPNSIVISPVTHRLVGALFDYRDLGQHALKGFSEPVHVRQVLGPSKVESRFEAQHQSGTSPLLGREEELALLLRLWEQAKSTAARVVLLTGEPGIGKSRLVRALRDHLAGEPHTPLSYYCSPNHLDSALYPNIQQLIRAAGFERNDTDRAKLEKLQSLLAQSSSNLPQDLPLFAALLSISGGDRYPLPEMTPQRRKERTLAALLDHVRRLAAHQPVLIIFEDLHWIDPTSSELLSLAIDRIKDQPILLVATARQEFISPWPNHPHVSTLSLSRLSRSEGQALIDGITRGKPLPADVLEQIVERTDGVPLFIEELTKTILESGLLREAPDRYHLTGPLPPFAIPSTLHASLLARLDRLASVKDVAQIGSTIGREFSYGLISAVAALPDHILQASLQQLVDAELIFLRGKPPDARYQFKHALVQDAAYASLIKSRRQQLHGGIARALQDRFPRSVEAEPEVVAHHLTAAGIADEAVDAWQRAGAHSTSRSAFREAASHFRRGIELAQQLPEPIRRAKEFALQSMLGFALQQSKGHSARETRDAFLRARDLLEETSSLQDQTAVLVGLHAAHAYGAEHRAALDVDEQIYALAVRHNDAGATLQAQRFLGFTFWWLGRFEDTRWHLERGLEFDNLNQSKLVALPLRIDHAYTLLVLSRTLWVLGYPEQASLTSAQLLVFAKETGDPIVMALALVGECYLGILGAASENAVAAADKAGAVCVENGLHGHELWMRAYQGIFLARGGNPARGICVLRDAMVGLQRISAGNIDRPLWLSQLAAAHADLGQSEAGFALLDEALQTVEITDERCFEAEIRRLQGEMLLTAGKRDESEVAFQYALKISRMQKARWWELRAAMVLARLWRDEGRCAEARDLLTPIYEWFTEGFDMADLKEAKALLDQLSAQK